MQRVFYASPADLIAVVNVANEKLQLQYTPTGLFEAPPPPVLELVDLLVATVSEPHNTYLVNYRGSEVNVRSVPQDAGGVLFAIDQLVNPDSITLTSTAWYTPDLAVFGRIATVSTSKPAKRIYGVFGRAIERHFRKINAAWVGPEAEAAWRSGARLAIGPHSSRECDLREVAADAV
jgi:hypothetical protein